MSGFHRRTSGARATGVALVAVLGLGSVLVPAVANAAEPNAAPAVIPALKTWAGGEGELRIDASSRIVADSELADVAAQLADDLDAVSGWKPAVVGSSPRPGDIVLDFDAGLTNASGGERFVEEGYELSITDRVEISAPSETGVFYGTRSVLQILMDDATRATLPKGESVDWPNYETRGFMLDVGRRFFTPAFIEDYISMMSWYKLNNFQIHLNDNQIDKPAGGWQSGYSGFRLKSDNPEYASLASEDGAYTRSDWQGFEDAAADHHVQIIPEIDVPAHSLPFIQWKPELGLNGGDSDHLDLTKPATTEVIKGVFDEFVPWFEGPDVHYGADEYPREYAAQYRTFFNDMAAHVRSLGKQPRAWGSMSVMNGNADGYDRDVIINTWNNGWYGMASAHKDGYRFINTNDANLYVVPFANYYHGTGLNNADLYANWQPNRLGGTQDVVPAGAPDGAMFAVWNDLVDRDYSELDVHGLMRDSFPVIAQKTWNASAPTTPYAAFSGQVSRIGRGPSLTTIEQTGVAGAGELSFGAAVTASSTDEGFIPGALTDGRGLTRWTTSADSAEFTVDLGEAQRVGSLEIDWAGNPPDEFEVVTSADGVFWQVAAEPQGAAQATVDLRGVNARYVTVREISSGGGAISAWGARVLTLPPLTDGATATSSGLEGPLFPAQNAIDGNPGTRWSASYIANPWLSIDLGAVSSLSEVGIVWEAAAASAYRIELSDDGSTWRTVATKTGMPAATGPSRADTVTFPEDHARYVRITVTGKTINPYLSIIDVTIPAPASASAEIVGVTTATADAGGVYAGAVPVDLAAQGADGSVTGLEYRTGVGAWTAVPSSGRVDVAGEGSVALQYRAKVGDTSVAGFADLLVDSVGPVTTIALTPVSGVGTPSAPVSAVISASDGASPLASVEYRIGDGAWTPIASGGTVTFDQAGVSELEARATDSRGNVGTVVGSTVTISTVPISTVAVSILVDGTATSQLRPGQEFTVAIADAKPETEAGVELHSDPVKLGTASIGSNGTGRLTARVPAGFAAGAHTVVVTAVDAAGTEQTIRVPVTVVKETSTGPGSSTPTTGQPGGGLASTGVNGVIVAGALTVAAVLVVAGVLLVRRRRADTLD